MLSKNIIDSIFVMTICPARCTSRPIGALPAPSAENSWTLVTGTAQTAARGSSREREARPIPLDQTQPAGAICAAVALGPDRTSRE